MLCGSAKYKKQEGQAFILGLCELSLFFSSHWKEVAANISNQVPDWISKPEYKQGLVGMGASLFLDSYVGVQEGPGYLEVKTPKLGSKG